ncbi:MAG: hypothetical protein U0894_13375 [Pirellulales bacterium]
MAEEKRPIAEEYNPTVRQWCEHVLRLRPDPAVRRPGKPTSGFCACVSSYCWRIPRVALRHWPEVEEPRMALEVTAA